MGDFSNRIDSALSFLKPDEQPGATWWSRALLGVGALGTLLIASQLRDIRRYLRMRSM
jgi:hypothetical protein